MFDFDELDKDDETEDQAPVITENRPEILAGAATFMHAKKPAVGSRGGGNKPSAFSQWKGVREIVIPKSSPASRTSIRQSGLPSQIAGPRAAKALDADAKAPASAMVGKTNSNLSAVVPFGQKKPPASTKPSTTIAKCLECHRTTTGWMGPAGTEYAHSFYCATCWSSWGVSFANTEEAVASATLEECVSAADFEVAALLSWCSPSFALQAVKVKAIDRNIAGREFERLCKMVGSETQAQQITDDLFKFAKMGVPSLRSALKNVGFPAPQADDAVMEKRVLLACMKDALCWNSLQPADLHKVCAMRRITISAETSHEDMFKLLAESIWEARGIPVNKLPNGVTPGNVLDRIATFERKNQQDLSMYLGAKFAGTCLAGKEMSKSSMLRFIRDIVVWDSFTTEQIAELCVEHGVPVNLEASKMEANGPERKRMQQMLLHKKGLEFLESEGKVLQCISDEKGKQELLQQYRRVEDLPYLGLRQELQQGWGLPVEPGMDRDKIVDIIKSMLVWFHMTVSQLKKEISALQISYDCSGKDSDELIQKLMIESAAARWRELGVPVDRFAVFHGPMKVVEQWESLERMSDVMLVEEWRQREFPYPPEEVSIGNVKRCLRSAIVWGGLSVKELTVEYSKHGTFMKSLAGEPEEKQHQKLVERLVEIDCTSAYCEAKGIPFQQLASFDSALELLSQFSKADMMSYDELMDELTKFGLPVDQGIDVSICRSRVKQLHVWAVLPYDGLKAECQKRGITVMIETKRNPLQTATDKRKHEVDLRSKLMVTFCEEAFWKKGVPARKLGSIAAAQRVADKFALYADMSDEDLKNEHRLTGLPLPEGARRIDCINDLQKYVIWNEMPLLELQRLSQEAGVFSTLDTHMNESAACKELVGRLVAAQQRRYFENHGVPVKRLDSEQASATLLSLFQTMERMSRAELVEQCSERGFPQPPANLTQPEILARLKWAIYTQKLTFVELKKEIVSAGIRGYHSAKEHQRPEILQRLFGVMWQGAQSKNGKTCPPQARPGQARLSADHLRTLELPSSASIEDIKKAFKRLALRYHPDKQHESQEADLGAKFREITEAYHELCEKLGVGK